MQVYRDLSAIGKIPNAVVTIGTFDGVHGGHRKIIERIRLLAQEVGGESVIVTFHPHPRHIITPDNPVYYLTTQEEKIAILDKLGVDNLVIIPFSRSFSEISAESYVEEFLLGTFHPKVIVFGYDHKFGKDRKGDIQLLKQIAGARGVRIEEIAAHEIDAVTVSSSRIRKYLLQGNVEAANALLGYPYPLSGLVVKGDQIGRTLGFPTANIFEDDPDKLIPADGVYVVGVDVGKQKGLYGLLSIGHRPTFNKSEKRIEVYILDFNESVYGEKMHIRLLRFLREDKKFDSRESLIEAIREDEKNGRAFLSTIPHV